MERVDFRHFTQSRRWIFYFLMVVTTMYTLLVIFEQNLFTFDWIVAEYETEPIFEQMDYVNVSNEALEKMNISSGTGSIFEQMDRVNVSNETLKNVNISSETESILEPMDHVNVDNETFKNVNITYETESILEPIDHVNVDNETLKNVNISSGTESIFEQMDHVNVDNKTFKNMNISSGAESILEPMDHVNVDNETLKNVNITYETESILEPMDHVNVDNETLKNMNISSGTESIIEPMDYVNVDKEILGNMNICECQSEMNRSLRRCKSSEISQNSTTVFHCHSEGHGKFIIRNNASFLSRLPQASAEYIGAFVRVNGPMIDTIFLTWSESEFGWVGMYKSCLQGNYSGAVYIYMRSFSDAEAVLRSEACLSELFFTPFLFFWAELAPSTEDCSSVWRWAERYPGDNASELSLFSPCPPRGDYVQAFSALRTLIPAVDWA